MSQTYGTSNQTTVLVLPAYAMRQYTSSILVLSRASRLYVTKYFVWVYYSSFMNRYNPIEPAYIMEDLCRYYRPG